jgi:hypothetical protein
MKKEKFKLIEISKFDESKFIIPSINTEKDNKERYFYNCFPKYEYYEANDYGNIEELRIKTGNICLVEYGVYSFKEKHEGYIKIALDENQESSRDLFGFIDKLDNIGKLKETQHKLYSNGLKLILKNSKYINLHKEGEENKNSKKIDYLKVLMDFDKETKNLSTKVYLYNKKNNKNKRINHIKSMKDLKKYVDIGAEAEFIISIEKIQVSKKLNYGYSENRFILRCKQIKINKKCIKKGPENMDMCGFSEDEYYSDEEINKTNVKIN